MAPVKRLGVCALAFCLSIGITGVTAGVVRSPEGEALSAFAASSTRFFHRKICVQCDAIFSDGTGDV